VLPLAALVLGSGRWVSTVPGCVAPGLPRLRRTNFQRKPCAARVASAEARDPPDTAGTVAWRDPSGSIATIKLIANAALAMAATMTTDRFTLGVCRSDRTPYRQPCHSPRDLQWLHSAEGFARPMVLNPAALWDAPL
jgi:hypothetical protein